MVAWRRADGTEPTPPLPPGWTVIAGVEFAPALDVAALGAALHKVYCRQNAPMHSAKDHSAARIADAYAEAFG